MHSKEHIKCEFSTGECKNEVKVFLFTIQIDIKITVKLLPFLNITKIKYIREF